MKIIKRNGSEAVFDIMKIISAVFHAVIHDKRRHRHEKQRKKRPGRPAM